ncbi:MAG: type I-E CRISPR-associated protein Cas6/Cse3/CasE [Syntrophomonadaceae bacterium]|nr:type I-E CRISPR-associated protein Cas6/Cse3/CasE [Syntrophomonadaceae bacterium]
MYLSRIPLNVKRRDTMQALASPHVFHSEVELSFQRRMDDEHKRMLWRVDYFGEMCYLLVLTADLPEFNHIANKFGYGQWEHKNYNPLLARLEQGQFWRFRLRANPVHSSFAEKNEKSNRGKVFAHVTQQQQKQWLTDRAQAYGFSLQENAFDVVHTEWKKFYKTKGKSHGITLRIADFEGILTISDIDSFRNALIHGIGRAKAYGCGLLTLARYKVGHDE